MKQKDTNELRTSVKFGSRNITPTFIPLIHDSPNMWNLRFKRNFTDEELMEYLDLFSIRHSPYINSGEKDNRVGCGILKGTSPKKR